MVTVAPKEVNARICCKFIKVPAIFHIFRFKICSSGAKCNGVCECAENFTYTRGKCRQLVNLNSACRDVTLEAFFTIKIDKYFHFRKLIAFLGLTVNQ